MPELSVAVFNICAFAAPARCRSSEVLGAAASSDSAKDRFSLSCNSAVLKHKCALSYLNIFSPDLMLLKLYFKLFHQHDFFL